MRKKPLLKKPLPRLLDELEKLSKKRGLKLYSIYYKLPREKKQKADEILDKIIEGKISYKKALKELEKLAKHQRR